MIPTRSRPAAEKKKKKEEERGSSNQQTHVDRKKGREKKKSKRTLARLLRFFYFPPRGKLQLSSPPLRSFLRSFVRSLFSVFPPLEFRQEQLGRGRSHSQGEIHYARREREGEEEATNEMRKGGSRGELVGAQSVSQPSFLLLFSK